jgi:hypothetical protein
LPLITEGLPKLDYSLRSQQCAIAHKEVQILANCLLAIASDLNVPLQQMRQITEKLKKANLKKYVTETVGEPTLRDIL